MNEQLRFSGWATIFITIFIGILMLLLPLPVWARPFRPDWLLLVILYWAIALPHRVGITIAWCWGLVLDVLQGTLFGENALTFVVVVYLAIKIHRQIRLFSFLGQACMIFLLLMVRQSLLFWIQGLQGESVSVKWFLGSALTSACLWPWLYIVLTDCLRRYRLT